MNFNTTLYTGSKLFTMNRNKFDFSDEQLILLFVFITTHTVYGKLRWYGLLNIVVMSLKIQIDLLIVIK